MPARIRLTIEPRGRERYWIRVERDDDVTGELTFAFGVELAGFLELDDRRPAGWEDAEKARRAGE